MFREEKNIIILGGGYSIRQQDVEVNRLRDIYYTIGVNDSAMFANVDACVSMDRLWMEHREPYMCFHGMRRYYRECAFAKSGLDPHPSITTFKNTNTVPLDTTDDCVLNGVNSGMCAINLALKMKPSNIFLFGFDMKRLDPHSTYWYEDYPWAKKGGGTSDGKYHEWVNDFNTIGIQLLHLGIKVWNVSPDSGIKTW